MALKKDIEMGTGIILQEAYYRVINVDLRKEEQTAYITVRLFKDKVAASSDKAPVQDTVYGVSTELFDVLFNLDILSAESNNPYKQAYEYLKTLEQFTDAIND